jgi:hypothetical protein
LYFQILLSEFQILQVLLKLKRRQNNPQLTFATKKLWTYAFPIIYAV